VSCGGLFQVTFFVACILRLRAVSYPLQRGGLAKGRHSIFSGRSRMRSVTQAWMMVAPPEHSQDQQVLIDEGYRAPNEFR
jgi:hypothetical protein